MRMRKSALLFAGLLAVGLLTLVGRLLARPDISVGEIAWPVLGGVAVAAALYWMVRQGRDRGTPPQ